MTTGEPVGAHRTALTIAPEELPAHADALLDSGFRVALIAGHDDSDRLRAVYLFTAAAPDRRVELRVPLDRDDPRVPSLAALSFPASRFEREMRDLFGIVPTDHPLPRRLVRHFHWPQGWYPMRADAGDPPESGDVAGPYPSAPSKAPGCMRSRSARCVVGETILDLKARLWFVHKGLEKLFQGRRPYQAVELAERISGDTAVGHTLAFCLAVEDALDLAVPPGRAAYPRDPAGTGTAVQPHHRHRRAVQRRRLARSPGRNWEFAGSASSLSLRRSAAWRFACAPPDGAHEVSGGGEQAAGKFS
ncbi:NADH-quinone oxidoreductase subunit C [Saccharopolyspora hattusasensis]|uniref:NADH-quinone oxidoreductase subunit C n=1 Tax=Saccharopolyspora hattusasensis TaxID=1128679 RepID=UPI003D96C49F